MKLGRSVTLASNVQFLLSWLGLDGCTTVSQMCLTPENFCLFCKKIPVIRVTIKIQQNRSLHPDGRMVGSWERAWVLVQILEYSNVRKTWRSGFPGPRKDLKPVSHRLLSEELKSTERVESETWKKKREVASGASSPVRTHYARKATQMCGHTVTAGNPRGRHRNMQ